MEKVRRCINHLSLALGLAFLLLCISFSFSYATEYVKGYPAMDIDLNTWYSGVSGDTSSNTPYYCFTTSARTDSTYKITLKNTSPYGLSVNKWGYDSQYGWGTEGWGVPSADPYNTTSYTYSSGSLQANSKYCLQVWSKGLAGSGDRGTFEIIVEEIISSTEDNSTEVITNVVTSNINKTTVSASDIKKASNLGATEITLGAKVKKIKSNAFKGTNITKVTVKTKKLKAKSVKGSLKGSKVKTIKVNVGNKKANKQYVKAYKKIFTKKNVGKKVSVK